MGAINAENTPELLRARALAEALECMLDEDLQELAQVTEGTTENWRRRGLGPEYALVGNRYLYPREAVLKFVRSRIKHRRTDLKGALL